MGLFGKSSPKPSQEEVKKALKKALRDHDTDKLRQAVEDGDGQAAADALDSLERRGEIHRDEHGIWQPGKG
jgi:hypothetical protein